VRLRSLSDGSNCGVVDRYSASPIEETGFHGLEAGQLTPEKHSMTPAIRQRDFPGSRSLRSSNPGFDGMPCDASSRNKERASAYRSENTVAEVDGFGAASA
jgi:hypothetical protein